MLLYLSLGVLVPLLGVAGCMKVATARDEVLVGAGVVEVATAATLGFPATRSVGFAAAVAAGATFVVVAVRSPQGCACFGRLWTIQSRRGRLLRATIVLASALVGALAQFGLEFTSAALPASAFVASGALFAAAVITVPVIHASLVRAHDHKEVAAT